MKILALERELKEVPEEKRKKILQSEAERVWELHQQDIFREIYFHREQKTAVLILECKDEQEANEVLDTLPLVDAGYITFELIPLVPYPGFSRLFNK